MNELLMVTDAALLDDEHKAAGEQITSAILLAADRAAMHFSAPTRYPIDETADSLEQLFLDHLRTRTAAVQRRVVAKTTASLGTSARAARLGVLADVDLRSAQPVTQLVLQRFGAAQTIAPAVPEPASPPAMRMSADPDPDDANAVIRCRIRKVTCVDCTNPEIGDDDMIVGGTVINDKGKSYKIGQMTLGEFNEGDKHVKTYSPPKWFAACNLASGVQGSLKASSWPKAYLATIVLCEQDNGGFPELLNKLLDFIKGKVATWAGATLGGTIGAAIGTAAFPGLGTLAGAAIGALIGWVLGKVVDFFKSWWEDDALPPFTSKCLVKAYRPGGVVTSDVQRFTVNGQGGEYDVELDWQVNWANHFADKFDAAVRWGDKIYFFSGSKYTRFDLSDDQVDDGYPMEVAEHWPGLWKEGVRAGVAWPNGKLYFFKGDEYIRVDGTTKKADPGYPKKIRDAWKGLYPEGIDAAFVHPFNGKAYFFKGDRYMRYDVDADRADPGYPLSIAANWHGSFAKDIDAVAVNGPYAYFFKGDSYIRYNLLFDKAETGVLKTDFYWPGL